MKIEANLLISKIKKDKFWIISYIFVLAVAVVYCLFNDENIFSNNKTFYLLIGYPKNLTNDKFIYTLINLYTIVYFIYFTITYFNYELENYCDNLIIREKTLIFHYIENLITLFAIIIISLIFIITYFNFKKIFKLKYN